MSAIILPIQASELLSKIHYLEQALLFWEGAQANPLSTSSTAQLLLCFHPKQQRICSTPFELTEFLAELNVCAPKKPDLVAPSWASLRSGWAGLFFYPSHASQTTSPLAEFYEYPVTLRIDLSSGQCLLNNPRHLTEVELAPYFALLDDIMKREAPGLEAEAESLKQLGWQAAWSAEQYQHAFQHVMEYLRAGDCYQVNLAVPFYSAEDVTQKSPIPLLTHFNPSFGGYFKSVHRTLFSVSPERFLSIHGDVLETRPIKGTVARGTTAEEDFSNKEWLANSPKNQAENLMIVDLLRNDLSRYAKPHSVRVEKLFAIETHANVHHMVSTICATKRSEVSAAKALYSAFPGGSITGAPKKRAMEIIQELEHAPRTSYCGSLGFFDDQGVADFNILIRTISANQHGAECWAGGGIVLDSTCAEEWEELHTKIHKILQEF